MEEAKGESELLSACAAGDLGRVKACLYLKRSSHAKAQALSDQDAKRRTPLHLATQTGNLAVVKELQPYLDGTHLFAQDAKGWTALHYAASRGSLVLLEEMIKFYDTVPSVSQPISSAAEMHVSKAEAKDHPLHVFVDNVQRLDGKDATPKKILRVVRALQRRMAHIDEPNRAGETALHLACYKGHLPTVEILCDLGASMHVKSEKNAWTSLHFAARAGHLDVVKYLVERGVNPLVRGNQGNTAADVAHQVHHAAITAYLQEYMRAYAQAHPVHVVEVGCAGDPGVGATSLLLRYTEDFYTDEAAPTAESFKLKGVEVDRHEVQLRLWLPTRSEAASARPRDAVVVYFDCTSTSSFDTAASCLDTLAKQHDCIKVLVATKTDVPATQRQVDGATAMALAERHHIPFFETSAKQNVNVVLPYRHIAQVWHHKAKSSSTTTTSGYVSLPSRAAAKQAQGKRRSGFLGKP